MKTLSAIVLLASSVCLTAQPPALPTRAMLVAKPAAVVGPPATNSFGDYGAHGEISGLCQNLSNAIAKLGTNGTGIAWFYGNSPNALTTRHLSTNFSNTFDFFVDSRLPLYISSAAYISNASAIVRPKHTFTNDIVIEPLSPVYSIFNPNMTATIWVSNSPLFGSDYVLTVWGKTNVVYTVEDGPDALGLYEPVTTFDGTNGPWIYVQPEDTNSIYKIFEVTGRN